MKSSDSIRRYLLDIFFPNRCPFCGEVIPWNVLSCEKCLSQVEWFSHDGSCPICAKKMCICGDDFHADRVLCVCIYEGIVKQGIINLKRNNGINLADIFAEKLTDEINSCGYDYADSVVTSVPMNRRKKRKTGYNHSEEIGKALAKKLKLQYNDNILLQSSDTVMQHSLNLNERRETVRGRYHIHPKADVKGRHIILCDDVYTTGSTINECARVLKENGAEYVLAACGASTELDNNKQ